MSIFVKTDLYILPHTISLWSFFGILIPSPEVSDQLATPLSPSQIQNLTVTEQTTEATVTSPDNFPSG